MGTSSLPFYWYLARNFRSFPSMVQNYRHGGLLARGPALSDAVLWNGTHLRHPEQSGLIGVVHELWFRNAYRIGVYYTPRPGDVVLDVGSHVGMFCIGLALRYPEVRIFAYEPSDNYAYLERNIRAFGLANVATQRIALGGERGQVVMRTTTQRSVDFRAHAADTTDEDAVEMITLADAIAATGASRIALLKMDIEGAEFDVFEHIAPETLERIDTAVLEYHENYRPGVLGVLTRAFAHTHEIRIRPDDGTGHGAFWAVR